MRILFDPYPPLKLTAKDAKKPCKIDAWTMKYMKSIVGMLSFQMQHVGFRGEHIQF